MGLDWSAKSSAQNFAIYHSAKILPIGPNVERRSNIQFLLRKLVRQRRNNVTSFCMQFEKIGRGLFKKLSRVRGSVLLAERKAGKCCCLTSFRKKNPVFYRPVWPQGPTLINDRILDFLNYLM